MKIFDNLFGLPQQPAISRTAQEYMRNAQAAQDMQNTANNLLGNSGLIGGTATAHAPGSWTSTSAQNALGNPRFVHPDPNTLPEMQMSLEDAHAMWLARFGGDWVKLVDVQDVGAFNWSRIANRLSNMRLLETDSSMGYYKLVPHIWK